MQVEWTIRKKLITILFLCTFAFLLIAAPTTSYISYQKHKQSADQQQSRLVGAVRVSAAIALFVQNEEIANDVLNGLLLDDEILAAELNGTDGFSLRAESTGERAKPLQVNHASLYPLYSPIDANQQIGFIRVWSNDELISERAIDVAQYNTAWLVAVSCLLSFASILAANILVGNPLRKLSGELLKVVPGQDTTVQVSQLHRHDEIGLVVNSINRFLTVSKHALDAEKAARHKIEQMNRHYNSIYASSHVGIMVLDENGVVLNHNPVLMERIIKLDKKQKQLSSTQDFFSIAFKAPDKAWDLVALARRTRQTVSNNFELSSAWNSPSWVQCLMNVNHDDKAGDEVIEIVLYDITSHIQEAENARQLSMEDALTGIRNRRGCEFYLSQAMQDVHIKQNLTLMLLDLDGFKTVNDTYGHAAGDKVLKTLAKRLQSATRKASDVVGRIGGDEFVVILNEESEHQAQTEKTAKAIIERVCQPIEIDAEHRFSLGVSIGIARAAHYEEMEALFKAADEAMYSVKSSGKNNYRFADNEGGAR